MGSPVFVFDLLMGDDLVGPDRRAGRSGGDAPGGRALPWRTDGSWRTILLGLKL
jgi:hypothetical protein